MIDFKLALERFRAQQASKTQEDSVAFTKKGTKPAKGEGKQSKGSDYDDTNRGVLFQNDKDGNESRPDYTGKINVDGTEKRIAAWVKTSDKVGDYLSISVSDPQES